MVSIAQNSFRRVLLPVTLLLVVISVLHLARRSDTVRQHASSSLEKIRDAIPNNVHYIWVVDSPDANASIRFGFKHFMSVYSAWYYWRPNNIYLHIEASSEAVARARVDEQNKWNSRLLNIPNVRVNYVHSPTYANGTSHMKLVHIEHRADFLKPLVLLEYGGIYLDFDAMALRDIAILRNTRFESIFAREAPTNTIQSGTIMAKKGSRVLKKWAEVMHTAYDGGWSSHSNMLLTWLVPRFVKYPGAALIMEQDAWTPLTPDVEGHSKMYAGHTDFPSPLNESNLATAPFWDDDERADVEQRHRNPQAWHQWEHDFSSTYILHAWSLTRGEWPIPNFRGLSPRYILERQSSIARAVYPAIKHAFDQGIIGLDD